ncbi:MAG: CoA transferase [Thermodesulfobacteriota bacterium]|nr:CoA transferase [Thermodesulfobacteriota bacterium]
MAEQALSDVKVLDLSWHIAGPYCTKLLAGLGAEVVKIERPGQGDPARSIGPFFNDEPHPEKSGLFHHLNTGKKSITLNLKSSTGKNIFLQLVQEADILVENFSPGVMAGFGLTYEVLEELNPKLVMTSISNFGSSGPYRDYKMTEIVAQALGGLMYITGDLDRVPLKPVGSQAQYQAGLNSFVGTMAAFYGANGTGIGQYVESSIMETMNSILEYSLLEYLYQGRIEVRKGNKGAAHPWGMYFCKDGYIGIAVVGKLWDRLVEWIDTPEIRSESIDSIVKRVFNRDEVDAALYPFFMDHTREEIYHQGQERKIPISLVRSPEDLVNAPQYRARGFWVDIDHPETGTLTYPGAPAIMSETPWQTIRPPLLGEHNEEIYCNRLGYTKEDLVKLKEMSII